MQTVRNSLLIEDHMTGIESGSCSVSNNGQRSSKVFGQDCIGWVAADAARGLQLVCRYVWDCLGECTSLKRKVYFIESSGCTF